MRIISTLLLVLLFNTAWAAEEHGGGHAGGSGEQAGPVLEYILLEPPLVINLQGKRRYLRADVQMLVEGQENVDRIKAHLPALRHSLIMLFANHDPASLASVAEREKMRTETMAVLKGFLDQYTSSVGLKDVFFSNFLVQ